MTLQETQQHIHHALQAAAGVGRALLPPKPDDSHMSFMWSDRHQALVQDVVDRRFRSGLRMRDLTLLLIDANDQLIDSYPLRGHTLGDGLRFYEERVGRMLVCPEGFARDVVLTPNDEELAQIAAMYCDAAAILERLRAKHPGASPVRCWPHHFDIAVLISLPEERSIGVGFLGGDTHIPEPYWYVYVHPVTENTMPPLSVGRWYAGAWMGAVLTGRNDIATTERFLDEAIATLT